MVVLTIANINKYIATNIKKIAEIIDKTKKVLFKYLKIIPSLSNVNV